MNRTVCVVGLCFSHLGESDPCDDRRAIPSWGRDLRGRLLRQESGGHRVALEQVGFLLIGEGLKNMNEWGNLQDCRFYSSDKPHQRYAQTSPPATAYRRSRIQET